MCIFYFYLLIKFSEVTCAFQFLLGFYLVSFSLLNKKKTIPKKKQKTKKPQKTKQKQNNAKRNQKKKKNETEFYYARIKGPVNKNNSQH